MLVAVIPKLVYGYSPQGYAKFKCDLHFQTVHLDFPLKIKHVQGTKSYRQCLHQTILLHDASVTWLLRIQASEFYVLQLDESTDVAGLAQLLVYVCYIYVGSIKDHPLLETRTTGEDIF
jgi:hypothetical protein